MKQGDHGTESLELPLGEKNGAGGTFEDPGGSSMLILRQKRNLILGWGKN